MPEPENASALERRAAPPAFRDRGSEISRLEGFSDCAFGFAITLLVVSLEVPNRFSELLQLVRGFPTFAVTFAIIAGIWYAHYRFFRAYGVQDTMTVVLTLALLFVVLFYVYPLKFVFRIAFNGASGAIADSEVPLLFTIYGLGYTAVWVVLGLMHVNAYRQRGTLELSPWEAFVTRTSIAQHFTVAAFGLLSAAVSYVAPEPYTGTAAGLTYFLLFIPQFAFGRYRNRARGRFASQPAPAG
jgi:uncharacterized membrane protein